MASTPQPQAASSECDVCSNIVWFQLQPEDIPAIPHHKSRTELEQSAKTCGLCDIVLKAAISNYRDSRSVRDGRGYWRVFHIITMQESLGTAQDIMYINEMGASAPAGPLWWNESSTPPVISATGVFDANLDHIAKQETLPNVGNLNLDEPPDDMPVWLYGNWWAAAPPKGGGDSSHLRFMGVGARFGRSPSVFDAYNTKKGSAQLRGSVIRVCTTDDSHALKYIPGRLREISSDSDIAFCRIENWIRDCISSHDRCLKPELNPPLPTRVIDVSMSDRTMALLESKGQRGRYTALSHSWGSSSRLMATTDSLDDLTTGIALSLLPKTFQDAIQITRRLGIKYLWIDCFCIIQDDPKDWEREAARMAQIYRYSYATLSAMASKDSHTGCFPQRNQDSYVSPGTKSLGYDNAREASGPRSHVVDYEHTSWPRQRNRIHIFEEWLPGSSYYVPQRMDIQNFGKRFDPLADQPLSARGWTLQERLLSPRTIHYASDQIYFECEDAILSEDGFKFPYLYFSMESLLLTQRCAFEQHGSDTTFGISFVEGKDPVSQNPGLRWKGGWLSLVENYSGRQLSFSKDKLSAVAGVARMLAEKTGDKYLAGLWGRHIYEDLCWRVYIREEYFDTSERGIADRPVKGKEIGNAVRPAEYRAPSWSWASIDAQVKFIPLSYSFLVAQVKECYTVPAGDDEFGRVCNGRLDIHAPIYEVQPYEPKQPWDRHGIPVKIDLGDERGVCAGAIHLDMPDEALQFPCYALFLDPAKALIIKSKDLEPVRDENGNEDQSKLIPQHIFTTEDINQYYREPPKGKQKVWIKGNKNSPYPKARKRREVTVSEEENYKIWEYWREKRREMAHQAINDAVRIGLGEFVKKTIEELDKERLEPMEYDPAVHGDLKLEDIEHTIGGQSWGPVTRDDPKVWVKLV